jgi:hypothetical protein
MIFYVKQRRENSEHLGPPQFITDCCQVRNKQQTSPVPKLMFLSQLDMTR